MKYVIHLMDKYDDVGETLKQLIEATLIVGAIVGLAPFLMWLSVVSI